MRRGLEVAAAAIAFVAVVTVLGACGGGGDGLLSFDVDVDIPKTTVPGATPLPSCEIEQVGPLLANAFGQFTFDFQEEEEFEGQGPVEFRSVVLDQIVLRIVDVAEGDSDDFDFVDSIRIFADDPTDTSAEVLIAELDPVPDGGLTEMVIPGTGIDIAEIASADQFIARVEATGRPPCDNVVFVGVAEFEVSVF